MKNRALRKVDQGASKLTDKEKSAIAISQNVFFLASNDRRVALDKPPFKNDYTYDEVLPRAIAELSFAMQNTNADKLS